MKDQAHAVDSESGTRRHCNVRIEKDVYAALRERCGKGLNFSQVVNAGLREWVNNKTGFSGPGAAGGNNGN